MAALFIALRNGLRQLGIARNTLLWFNSDNGGLPGYGKEAVGHLRGHKNTMYEGGLRVPGIIEWPAVIQKPRTTSFRAGTMDIFPTIAEAAALPYSSMLQPQDGISLMPLFEREIAVRPQPLFFYHRNRGVVIDGDHKLMAQNKTFELYNLANDEEETRNLYKENDPVSQRLLQTTVGSRLGGVLSRCRLFLRVCRSLLEWTSLLAGKNGERGLQRGMDFPNILCLCRMRGSYIRLIALSQSGSSVG